MSRRLFNNFLWLFTEHGIAVISGLLVTVVLARSLSVESYGALSACIAFVALFTPLFQVGLNGLLVKQFHLADSERQLMKSAWLIRFVSSIVFGIVAVLISFNLSAFSQHVFVILLLIVGQLGLSGALTEQWFHAKKSPRIFSSIRGFTLLVFALVKCTIVYYSDNILYLALAYCFENLTLGIASWLAFNRKCKGPSGPVSIEHIKSLLRKGSWLILSSFAAIIYLKIDQVMIASMLGESETGIYAVAAKIAEVAYFLPTIAVAVLFPSLIEAEQQDRSAYFDASQSIFGALFFMGLMVCICCVMLSGWLLPVLFGEAYLQAVPVLNIYIWSSIIVFMRALVSRIIIIDNLLPFSLVSHGVGAALNVILNLWLIEEIGIIGAAYATVLSYIGGAFLIFLLFKRTRWFAFQMCKAPISPLLKLFK